MRALPAATLLLPLVAGACTTNPKPVTPQRPTFSSNTQTTSEDTFELEAGLNADPDDTSNVTTLLKYGLSPTSEVFVGLVPYKHIEEDSQGDTQQGLGNTTVGVRHRVWESDGGLSGAYQFLTKLPTADEDDELGSGEIDFFGAAILTQDLGALDVTGFYQLGILGETDDDGTDTSHLLALASSLPITDPMGLFAEITGIYSPRRDDLAFATFGATYSLSQSTMLDFGMRVGLNADSPDAVFIFGVTTNFGHIAR